MFCSNCGRELDDAAKFCSNCGMQIVAPDKQTTQWPDSGSPVLVLRPRFIGWVTVIAVLPLQLFMTAWGAGFCGGFAMFAIQGLDLPIAPWMPFVFFGCLFFITIPLVVYTARKRTYAQTEYRFYRNRLEYVEGFWTAENKTIQYTKITETMLRRGVIQKKYGLGTIFLMTSASGFMRGKSMSGVRVQDIEEPERAYATIKNLIGC